MDIKNPVEKKEITSKDREYKDDEGYQIEFLNDPTKKKDPKSKFVNEVFKRKAQADKEHKLFCDRAAMDDFEEHFKEQKRKILRKYGEINEEGIKSVKPFKPNWEDYSNPKNFELIEENEMIDTDLTKQNPGLTVKIKHTKYRYKYGPWVEVIAEEPSEAILRARKQASEVFK